MPKWPKASAVDAIVKYMLLEGTEHLEFWVTDIPLSNGVKNVIVRARNAKGEYALAQGDYQPDPQMVFEAVATPLKTSEDAAYIEYVLANSG